MDKISIFSKPEEIDEFMKVKIKAFPAIGGKSSTKTNSWKENELELRNAVIMDYITTQGLSKEKTAQQIADRWDISVITARAYVTQACKAFTAQFSEEDQEKQRQIWLERVESILQEAIESRDKQSALRAMDLMAKSMGIYKENLNLGGGDKPISFDFS